MQSLLYNTRRLAKSFYVKELETTGVLTDYELVLERDFVSSREVWKWTDPIFITTDDQIQGYPVTAYDKQYAVQVSSEKPVNIVCTFDIMSGQTEHYQGETETYPIVGFRVNTNDLITCEYDLILNPCFMYSMVNTTLQNLMPFLTFCDQYNSTNITNMLMNNYTLQSFCDELFGINNNTLDYVIGSVYTKTTGDYYFNQHKALGMNLFINTHEEDTSVLVKIYRKLTRSLTEEYEAPN